MPLFPCYYRFLLTLPSSSPERMTLLFCTQKLLGLNDTVTHQARVWRSDDWSSPGRIVVYTPCFLLNCSLWCGSFETHWPLHCHAWLLLPHVELVLVLRFSFAVQRSSFKFGKRRTFLCLLYDPHSAHPVVLPNSLLEMMIKANKA